MKMRTRWTIAAVIATSLLAGCPEPETRTGPVSTRYSAPQPNVPESDRVPLARAAAGQLVYASVYSHIYYAGGQRYLLESTLSIRNTDLDQAITVNAVDYYDSDGQLVRHHLDAPLRLQPLASAAFLVETRDKSGGSGANFLVEWVADDKVEPPLIESLMAGMSGTHGLSFSSAGRVVDDRN